MIGGSAQQVLDDGHRGRSAVVPGPSRRRLSHRSAGRASPSLGQRLRGVNPTALVAPRDWRLGPAALG
jgi:hypothetical protein